MRQIRYIALMALFLVLSVSEARAQYFSGANAALGSLTAPLGITNSDLTTPGFIKNACINGNCPVTAFGAIPESSIPTVITATTNGTTAVSLSGVGNFGNQGHIVIYGAGPACTVGSCNSAPAAPTATVQGYAGAGGGATTTYTYGYSVCDTGWGCTPVSSAGSFVAAPLLTQPKEASVAGNNITVTAASPANGVHWVWWRSTNGGTTWLVWRVTDVNTFTDVSNHQGMDATHGPFTNTPLAAQQNQLYEDAIVSGAGTTSLVVNSIPTQTGSFRAFPDDTDAFNAVYTACTTLGGAITVPPGTYKVRTISARPNCTMSGPAALASSAANIVGTPGMDLISLPASTSGYTLRDLAFQGGRSEIVSAPGGYDTYVALNNISMTSPDYAGIYARQTAMEEWYVDGLSMNLGWYGISLEDNTGDPLLTYNQKSNWKNLLFNGQLVSGLHVDVRDGLGGSGWDVVTFDHAIFQGIDQDAIYNNAPFVNVTMTAVSNEGTGLDSPNNTTTATCTNASDVYVVASATGLAVGQDYTVYGCGATGLPVEGTICALSGTNVTLEDPTCTTPVNAAATVGTGQTATNAWSDVALLTVKSGSQFGTGSRIFDALLAPTGGCCGGTRSRYVLNTPNGALLIVNTSSGPLYNSLGSDQIIDSVLTDIRPTITANNLNAGQFTVAQGLGGVSFWGSPLGGDLTLGLVDTLGNTSGTFGQFRVRKNDVNRTSVWSVDGTTGNQTVRGHFTVAGIMAGQTNAAVSACGTSPGAVTGGDLLGHITTGTGPPATCSITFGQAYATAPNCFCQDNTTAAATCKATTSTTLLTMTLASNAASDVVQWLCMSN